MLSYNEIDIRVVGVVHQHRARSGPTTWIGDCLLTGKPSWCVA